MTRDLERRLKRLEASEQPPRLRSVFCRKGEPSPEPVPGEQLLVIRWIERDDDPTPEPAR